jgi:hypothetical protein
MKADPLRKRICSPPVATTPRIGAWPRQLYALWVAILVQVLGRISDGIWHLNHEDFEGAVDQIEAHFVLWTGVLMTLAASGWGLRTDPRRSGRSATC